MPDICSIGRCSHEPPLLDIARCRAMPWPEPLWVQRPVDADGDPPSTVLAARPQAPCGLRV